MSTGITFSGLSSGIDSDSIVSKLIALEGRATTRLQQQQKVLKNKDAVYGQLLDKISTFAQSAGGLNVAAAFNPVSATSSDTAVATIAATADAPKGTYALKVTRLAQAQKVATAAQTDTASPLNLSGKFVVNGKAVTVDATDSLRTIAGKINELGVGVAASLIDGGSGAAYLTLAASATGAANRPQIADLSGGVLGSLGLLGATDGVRNAIPYGAASAAFGDTSTAVGTSIGGSVAGARGFAINGTSVSIDLGTDSLQAIADKINAAGTGASATVAATSVNGATKYQLKITGTSGTPTFSDADGALHALGVLQKSAGNELLAGQDAAYSLDGVNLTSATNEIKGAIPGATITLLKGDTATPKETTIALSRDTAAVKTKVNGFIQAANGALQYIKDASQFDKDNYDSGPLFGDPAARQFESSLTTSLFRTVANPGAKYTNLAAIGFGITKEGLLEADEAKFDAAMADRPDEVRRLFQSSGIASGPGLSYVSSTKDTPGSVGDGFDINVTQVATKSSLVAGMARTGPSAATEKLSFTGALFSGSTLDLTLDVGSTLASTIDKINSDSRLKEFVVASDDGTGKLRLDGRKWGTGGRFAVTSNVTAAVDNSGIGVGNTSTKTDGLDVAGTIGGAAATGFGQYLTADATNTAAKGLQILYTGTALGSAGKLRYVKGLSATLAETVSSFNDTANGLITTAQKSAQDAATAIDTQVAKNQAALDRRTTELKAKFASMETVISKLKAQGQQLSSLTTISSK